jgi:cytochrome c551/c552
MSDSRFRKDQNQNDIVDSGKAFMTSFGVLTLVFVVFLVGSFFYPKNQGEQAGGGGTAPVEIKAEDVFKANCAGCHGQNLEGISGPNLTKVGSKYDAEGIKKIIKEGKGIMPPGILTDEKEIDAVAKWLSEKK